MSASAEVVLGGIMLGGAPAFWRVADVLTAHDFPTPVLGRIYTVCSELAKDGSAVDAVAVADECERQGIRADIYTMAGNAHSAANIRSYAERVKRDAMERQVRAICADGAKTGDIATVQSSLTALLTAQPSHALPASDALGRMWKSLMARYESGDELAGISTGFPKLDEMLGGLQPGRVYGIGARAKMGKTVLAMNICANAALAGVPTAVWSLEMSDEELVQRMASAVSGVESMYLQHPKLLDKHDTAMSSLNEAMKALKNSPLRISDRTDVTIEQIESHVRQMRASGQCDLLCIDYLGLLKLPKLDRHDLSIAHVTRRVKIIAKELRIPVILVFQLNRGSESGQQVRAPRPSDAKDSGAIEQDLDAMLLLHRPGYYDKGGTTGLRLDVALQRNGPTGLIRLEDQLDRCRFQHSPHDWQERTSPLRDNDL